MSNKISVLIPTHNRPQFFETCLKSALDQNYKNIEILVSDDSDCDNYAKEIVTKYGSGIRYFKKDATGATDNYKNLLKEATGEYSIFLEDDDFFATTGAVSKYADLLHPGVTGVLLQYVRSSEIKKFFETKKHTSFSNIEFFNHFPNREDPCGFQLGQLMFKTDIVRGLDYSLFRESPFLDEVTLFFLSLQKGIIIESNEVSFFLREHNSNMTWGNEGYMLSSGFTHIEEITLMARKTFSEKEVSLWRAKMLENYSEFFKGLL